MKRLFAILTEKKVDAIYITDPYNVRYISGFTGEGALYISLQRQILMTDSRYTIWAKEQVKDMEILEIHQPYPVKVSQLLKEEQAHVLAIESKHMRVYDYEQLCKSFQEEKTEGTIVSLTDEITRLRAVKTEEEIQKMAKAEAIGDAAFEAVLSFLKPGRTEKEVADYLERKMKEQGAEGLSFETIAAAGLHSAKPHAVPGDYVIKNGDFLTMDFGCRYEGYCSDMTRTVVIGKASEKQKKLYNTVKTAQELVLQKIHAGMKGKEIDAIARDYIREQGYGDCFGHGLGHSVGLEIHETPSCSIREERIIEEGMIETVEPGIYVEGFGGVRIEDMVVVTKEGCRNLTHSTKELIEIMDVENAR